MKETEGLNDKEKELLGRFTMKNRIGDYADGQACVMACAVALWRFQHGEDLGKATDELDCVCPVLRRLAIRLNDGVWWPGGDSERTAMLLPLVPRLLDTADEAKTKLRMYRVADWAVRTIFPIRLRAMKKEEEAQRVEMLAVIIDKETSLAARDLVREVAKELWGACWRWHADDDAAAAGAAAAAAGAAAAADGAAAAADDDDAADAAGAAAAGAGAAADDDDDDDDAAADAAAAAMRWVARVEVRASLQGLVEELLVM